MIVDVLGRHVIAEMSRSLFRPTARRLGIECHADRVAQALGKDAHARASALSCVTAARLEVLPLVAEIARGAHGQDSLPRARRRIVRVECRQSAGHHGEPVPGARIEPHELALLGDVHGVADGRDAEGPFNPLADGHHAVDDAVMIASVNLMNHAGARLPTRRSHYRARAS